MRALFSQLKLQETSAVGRQIRKHVRELIVTGKLAPGDRLPSTQELADLWETHVPTVHLALKPLVREGILTRIHRVGTFVRQPEPKITCVGVYYSSDFWLHKTFAFYGALHAELQKLLRQSKIDLTVWVDPRPVRERKKPWEALVRAARHRKIQALVVTGTDAFEHGWLSKLPVPSAYLWSGNIPNAVCFDYRQFVDLSLQYAVQQGSRSVGLIADMPCTVSAQAIDSYGAGFYGHFVDRAQDWGLEVRNEWIRFSKQEHLPGTAHEQFGYDEFRSLWQQRVRPNTLVVWPDSVARGTILALLELGVRVPQELKLVLHKSDVVDLFCPVPASFVVGSIKQIATALWEQILRQTRHESCQLIQIPFQTATPLEKQLGTSPKQPRKGTTP